MIKKEKGKYTVKSEDGKKSFGSYSTRKEAIKRLGQVEYFKNKKKYADGGMYNDAQSLSPIMKNSYAGKKKDTNSIVENPYTKEKPERFTEGGSKKARKEAVKKYAEGGVNKKTMSCNKPRRSNSGKKTHVVKACQNGKEKIVRFGHKMPDGTNNPKRRKSYCARAKGIGGTKNKLKANYWSRRNWKC